MSALSVISPSRRLRLAQRRLFPIIVGLLGLITTYHWWAPMVGGYLISADVLQRADAVVPLAGDPERAPYAAELARTGYADYFVATDMPINDPRVRFVDIVKDAALEAGVASDQILEAPGTASTTYQEAQIIRRLAQTEGWNSVIIVTSPYHTYRSRIIFGDVFRDSGIHIMVQSVAESWYTRDSWWKTSAGRQQTWMEYAKLVAYTVGVR